MTRHVAPALLLALAVACSAPSGADTDSDSGTAAETGTGTAAGTTTGDTPTSDGSDTGNTGGPGDPSLLVGSFQFELVAPTPATDEAPETPGKTTVIGKIYDGPSPSQLVWEDGEKIGACQLRTPRVPFCSTPCGGSAVCVEDDTCEPYPKAGSAGPVTVSGVALEGGGDTFTMEAIVNNYQPPATAKLLYPGFAEGDTIRLAADGDVFGAFKVHARGIGPLVLTSAGVELAADTAVTLTWTAAAEPDASTVHVKLDISHHGGTKGMIECDGPDNGAIELAGPLVSQLLDLGVAGFPSIEVARRSVGYTTIAEGRIDLVLTSRVERAVEIAGLISCNDDTACPDGQTCQPDLKCS
jgi:hypothetical protein